jgi:hypothetical protein
MRMLTVHKALAGSIFTLVFVAVGAAVCAQGVAPTPTGGPLTADPDGGSVAFARLPNDTSTFSGMLVYPKNDAQPGQLIIAKGGPAALVATKFEGPLPTGTLLYDLSLAFATASPVKQTAVHFRGALQFTINIPASYVQTAQSFWVYPYDSGASPKWLGPAKGTLVGAIQGSGPSAFQQVRFSVSFPALDAADTVAFLFASAQPPKTAWSGDFTGFPGEVWQRAWKIVLHTIPAGYSNAQSDPSLPVAGTSLHVHYDAHSSGFSCPFCGYAYGGLQFDAFAPGLSTRPATLYLKYYVKFPAGFDWGIEGKLPGLFGGASSSCSTSGTHCTGAWSTRLEWHTGKGTGRCDGAACGGEIYLDNGCGDTQIDVGRGNWSFAADGNWHSIEQFVDTSGQGTVTIWYDGDQVAQTAIGCPDNSPVAGIFFQTFYGGNAAKYGPDVPTDSYFGGFQTSTSFI